MTYTIPAINITNAIRKSFPKSVGFTPGFLTPQCGQVLALVLFFGVVWIASQLNSVDTGSGSSRRIQTASARAPRVYTDAEIQDAIKQSDDYETYRAEFTAAARTLLESRRCGRYEMTEYSGFVRSPSYKDRPVYFTYCGDSTRANRIYLDVSTGEIFK